MDWRDLLWRAVPLSGGSGVVWFLFRFNPWTKVVQLLGSKMDRNLLLTWHGLDPSKKGVMTEARMEIMRLRSLEQSPANSPHGASAFSENPITSSLQSSGSI